MYAPVTQNISGFFFLKFPSKNIFLNLLHGRKSLVGF